MVEVYQKRHLALGTWHFIFFLAFSVVWLWFWTSTLHSVSFAVAKCQAPNAKAKCQMPRADCRMPIANLLHKKGRPPERPPNCKAGSACLEHQLALELDDASRRQSGEERSVRSGRRRRRRLDLAKRAVGEVVVRVGEVRVIEHVVEVRTHAERQPLGQLEILVDRQVGVEEPRSAQAIAALRGERGSGRLERRRVGALA